MLLERNIKVGRNTTNGLLRSVKYVSKDSTPTVTQGLKNIQFLLLKPTTITETEGKD